MLEAVVVKFPVALDAFTVAFELAVYHANVETIPMSYGRETG